MRMQFRAPTEYYCETLVPIDERICAMLEKRKEVSQNNPGFPHLNMISSWCHKYGLKEELMRSIFASLYYEHRFIPHIEPSGFIKFVSVLKSVEIEGVLIAVTHIKQYKNASVIYIEAEANIDEPNYRFEHLHFELFISQDYACRPSGGSGHDKSIQHSFIVTPPLPDDVDGLEFRITTKPFDKALKPQAITLQDLTVTIK